jgi:serine/threonine protein kinase/WD40 repeat protein/tetratricopeptide (TPR) repeat protein
VNADPQKVRSIFLAAVESREPDQWGPFLEEACAGNPELRRRVEVLLRAHQQFDSLLDDPAPTPPATIDEPVRERPGTLIGSYKLLEEIGEGGFGVVFMAEQQQPVRRKVAMKILKPGMDTRQVVARFEAERQALALMDHPNIAQIHDGGETAGGRPYFVMELVKGIPITDYCDQCQLATRDRLELSITVCQAVQHAHQKGIIHRDLKPSNVLVTLHDGKPVVKVIDFGIAKAMGQQLTEKTLFTNFAQLVGTPMYMSPEQAALSGLDVDTRSDIYALGVLLYELLTGTTPFDKERFRTAGYDEIRRIIREEEPPRPSTRISTLGPAAATLSSHRQCNPRNLSQLFRGELDWIVMKCLEKDRNRRYETANSLALDLQHYLRDEHVLACPPSALYRVRKFARRNKVALLTVALVAGVLVVGTVVSTWQWIRAWQAEGLAESRWEREQGERVRATKAERAGQHQLFKAKLAEGKASRWSGRVGRRFDGLKALAEAARLAQDLHLGPEAVLELRNEMIACLALVDLRLDTKRPGYPAGTTLTGIAFDPDMQRYARTERDGSITVRQLADNKILVRIKDTCAPLKRQDDWRMTLVFSPDGQFLAGSGDMIPGVPLQLWNLNRPRSVLQAAPAGGYHRMIDFSPDSRVLAARGPDPSSLRFFDVLTGKETKRVRFNQPIRAVRFHPGGDRVAVSAGFQVHVVDLTGRPTNGPLSHPNVVPALSWSADGRRLAAACDDRQAYVWEVASGRKMAVCNVHEYLGSIAFNQRGDLLAVAGGETTHLWDPVSGKRLLSASGLAADFSQNDRWLGLGVSGADVGRWEVALGGEYRPLHGHPREAPVHSLDVSPDGRWLASAADDGVRLWDARAGTFLAQLPTGVTASVIFDRSGRFLITSGARGAYRWQIRRGPQPRTPASRLPGEREERARFQLGPAEPICLPHNTLWHHASLSDDGRTFAVRVNYGQAVILDLERPRDKPRYVKEEVGWLRLSPDGKWLASSIVDGYGGKLWDAQTGKRVRDFLGMRGADVVFSPDNRWLVFASAREYLFYRVGSWEPGPRVPRDGAGQQLGPVAFSPDRVTAAIAYSSRTIRLIECVSGRELATLSAPESEELKSLCFTPAGDRLFAGTWQGVIQVWDLRRIREQLRALGLDWNPPLARTADEPKPLKGEVVKADQDPGWALEVAKRAIERDPDNGILLNTLGVAYYRAGNWRAAIQTLKKAEDLGSQEHFAHDAYVIAMAYAKIGEKRTAAKWYRAAARWTDRFGANSEELRRWRGEAAALLGLPQRVPHPTQGKPEDDRELCTIIIEANPEAAWAYLARGQILRQDVKPQKAHEDFRKAAELDTNFLDRKPNLPARWASRAMAYAELADWQKAANDWQKANHLWEKLTPSGAGPLVWYQLALSRLGANDQAGYRSVCAQIVKRFSDKSWLPYADVALWACVVGPDAAVDHDVLSAWAEKLVAARWNDINAEIARGVGLYRAGRYEEAVRCLREAQARLSRTPDARTTIVYPWYFLAMAHQRLGKSQEARQWLEKANREAEQGQRRTAAGPPLTWNRRLTLELLRRQAEALVKETSKKPE